MTGLEPPTAQQSDDGTGSVDRHLAETFEQSRAAAPAPDPRRFLSTARGRRDRLRRRRRIATVTIPVVLVACVVVGVIAFALTGRSPTTSTASRTSANPPGGNTRPIVVTPDRGLTDGQVVDVAAFQAKLASFSQCAIVRSADGRRFYACLQDPTALSDGVQGHSSAQAGEEAELVARGTLTMHERLRGRLTLLSYPDGQQTGLVAESADVSCTAAATAMVTPVPKGTSSDTMAPAPSANAPGSTQAAPAPTGGQCVVIATGAFFEVTDRIPTASIFFGNSGPPTTGAARTATAVPLLHGRWADVELESSHDAVDVRIRPTGATDFRSYGSLDMPNPSDAWVASPYGLADATIHVVILNHRSRIANASDVASVAVGTVPCGSFTCLVYEVPRDRSGPAPQLHVAADGKASSIPLDEVPADGGGRLRFHVNG